MRDCLASLSIDRRFVAWAVAWAMASLVAFGLVSAIIPNPVFGRQVPPEPFAVAIWVAAAPLMGVIGATYSTAPRPASAAATLDGPLAVRAIAPVDAAGERTSSRLGTLAGIGAFLAIGCPVCNKVALLALGASGAMTIWAPLQPVIGAASLVLLTGTVAWRLRLRRRGGACPV